MTEMQQIQPHMEVVGSDGQHVGVVDAIENSIIKLTRNDPDAEGQHHYIPLTWVEAVTQSVQLSIPAEQARNEWTTEAPVDSGDASGTGGSAGPATTEEDMSGDMYALNRQRSGGEVF
jgi:hypothetical protein